MDRTRPYHGRVPFAGGKRRKYCVCCRTYMKVVQVLVIVIRPTMTALMMPAM